jgi:hypothetical protein
MIRDESRPYEDFHTLLADSCCERAFASRDMKSTGRITLEQTWTKPDGMGIT